MIEPRLVLCSGALLPENSPLRANRKEVRLESLGLDPNVNIRIEDVEDQFLHHLSPRLIDLLEIASYVYTADAATRRGSSWIEDAVESWRRDFLFVIPVRDLGFWRDAHVQQLLKGVLSFLSDDNYEFEFQKLTNSRPIQEYLEIGNPHWPFENVERVIMFSGGLDSLAGALDTAQKGEKLVLVSHRPVGTIAKRQRELFAEIKRRFPDQMIHVPVWVNKHANYGHEPSQRTRSFLFSALGTIVGESLNSGGVRFFENGVISLNLPVADEVVSARASRTTHPWALDLFSKFYALVLGREFVVDNPYAFKTKNEVVSIIGAYDATLISYTSSCAHVMFQSKSQRHCGTCSQCIDRRIAILASKLEEFDPETDYVSDVFIGPRTEGYQQNMAVDYVRHARELDIMSEIAIASRFSRQLASAGRVYPSRRDAMQCFIDMHKRHGETVGRVITEQLQKHAKFFLEGSLDSTSLIAKVGGQQHTRSTWLRLAERISGLLEIGVPIACKNNMPNTEPALQQVCDSILQPNNLNIIREFPFAKWAWSGTKPDWSVESAGLWIELKYIREQRDLRQTNEDIAADITKYTDNGYHVLFIVYDPRHLITNELEYTSDIERHDNILIKFLR